MEDSSIVASKGVACLAQRSRALETLDQPPQRPPQTQQRFRLIVKTNIQAITILFKQTLKHSIIQT